MTNPIVFRLLPSAWQIASEVLPLVAWITRSVSRFGQVRPSTLFRDRDMKHETAKAMNFSAHWAHYFLSAHAPWDAIRVLVHLGADCWSRASVSQYFNLLRSFKWVVILQSWKLPRSPPGFLSEDIGTLLALWVSSAGLRHAQHHSSKVMFYFVRDPMGQHILGLLCVLPCLGWES